MAHNPALIARRFDASAARYDQQADLQAAVAKHLVSRARIASPASILDIGSGTGFVAQLAGIRWPQAQVTALDSAPAMLRQAQHKLPGLKIIEGDAATIAPNQKFDLIFSSMALHWLADPRVALGRWRGWLQTGGALHVALPAAGSFAEWRDLCTRAGMQDGLWPMPAPDFADDIAWRQERQRLQVTSRSAHEFWRRLKSIGAATARQDHRPQPPGLMRTLLRSAPRPFTASYEILYLDIADGDF